VEPSSGIVHLRQQATAMVNVVLSHQLPRLAAALTYYTVLSLFPSLLVVVALLGLVGLSPQALQAVLDAVAQLGAQWAVDFVSSALNGLFTSQSSALALGLGTLLALWAASSYVGAFMWAVDTIGGVAAQRPFWRGLALRLGLALLLLTLLATTATALAMVGPLGTAIVDATGLSEGALHLWAWIKWPLLFAVGFLMVSLLYRFAPARRQGSARAVLTGALTGVCLWLVVTALFNYYLTHWAAYDRLYGALATAIAFLVWAWMTNLALLVGDEVVRLIGQRGRD
jgi:membrane protein